MGKFGRFLLAAVLTIPLLTTGCAVHRPYAWGPGQQAYYVRWEHDTHRNHIDYDKRDKSDQRAYQKWRKGQH